MEAAEKQPESAAETLAQAVWTDPDRLSGATAFRGTRVPVRNLFDYLSAGKSVDVFLDDFPGVSRAQVQAVLGAAATSIEAGSRAA